VQTICKTKIIQETNMMKWILTSLVLLTAQVGAAEPKAAADNTRSNSDVELSETLQLPECHSIGWVRSNTQVNGQKGWDGKLDEAKWGIPSASQVVERNWDWKLDESHWRQAVAEKGEGKKEAATFELWMPGDIGYAKGIVVISKHGAGRNLFAHPELRKIARELHLAIFMFEGNPVQRGFWPRSLLYERLNAFAEKSGHPELAHAPLFLFGHSNGTGFSAIFPAAESGRVWGWVSMRPGTVFQVYQPGAAQIPGLVIFGEDDQFFARPSKVESVAVVQAMRKNCGALWNCVVEPKTGHVPGEATWPIFFSFLRHTFAARVPADADPRQGPVKLISLREEVGYLGQNWDAVQGCYQTLPLAPFASFSGDKAVASWLLNAEYAADWQKFQAEGRLAGPSNGMLLVETFESGKAETLPDGWVVSPSELMTASISDNPTGGRALVLTKAEPSEQSPTLSSPRVSGAPETGIVCVKASVMAMQDDAIGSLLVQAPGGVNNVFMNLGRGKPMLLSDGGGVTRLDTECRPGQWMDFLFRLNLDTKRYDVFVNGKLAARDVGYGTSRAGGSLQIQFAFNRASKGIFRLDNLEIVAGDVALPLQPVAVSPDSTAPLIAPPFPGIKSDFRGCDLYRFKVGGTPVSVICPKTPAPGKPWLWRGSFWGDKMIPATELTVLADLKLAERGFHVVIAGSGVPLGHPDGNKAMDAVYKEMTATYGLAAKPALMGLSREALSVYRWASANPDKVACIYIDNGVCDLKSWPGGKKVAGNDSTADGDAKQWELLLKTYKFTSDADALAYSGNPVDILEPLAKVGVPLLHVCGESDTTVPVAENSAVVKSRYEKLGGKIEVVLKPGAAHHPHGLEDPAPILDFIQRYVAANAAPATPASSTTPKAAELVADNGKIMARVDRDDAIYRAGEKAVFTISLAKGVSLPVENVPWTLTNDGTTVIRTGVVSLTNGSAQVEGTLDSPGVLRLTVGPVGNPGESGIGVAAAAFDPFKIEATARPPADFEAFWQSQMDQLAKIPFDVKIDKIDSGQPGVEAFDVSLSVDANRRVHGYLALPSNGTNLPALVSLPGAGVRSAYLSKATAWAARGFLAMDVSVNDLPNGQSDEFYVKARNSPWNNTSSILNSYPFIGKENRDNFYFRQVILGLLRAVDFVVSRPEWNHKTLIAMGASQGGGLSIILTGLDSRITAVAANVPALCDHSGIASGQPSGWPGLVRTKPDGTPEADAPAILATAAYYDACNFARRIKVPAVMSVGLIDTLPPTTGLAAYNLLGGPKKIHLASLSGHSGSPLFPRMVDQLVEEQISILGQSPTTQRAEPAHGDTGR
jgi:dienelactone hydrolase